VSANVTQEYQEKQRTATRDQPLFNCLLHTLLRTKTYLILVSVCIYKICYTRVICNFICRCSIAQFDETVQLQYRRLRILAKNGTMY